MKRCLLQQATTTTTTAVTKNKTVKRNGYQHRILLLLIAFVGMIVTDSLLLVVSGYNMIPANHYLHHNRHPRPYPPIKTTTTTTRSATTTNDNNPSSSNIPVPINKELGCSPTLTVLFGSFVERMNGSSSQSSSNDENNNMLYFDPLNLATDTNFAYYRECELKHARIAMVSSLTCIIQTIYKNKSTILVSLLEQQHSIDNIFDTRFNTTVVVVNLVVEYILTTIASILVITAIIGRRNSNSNNNNRPYRIIVITKFDSKQQQKSLQQQTSVDHIIPSTLMEFLTLLRPSPFELLENWTFVNYIGMVVVCAILELGVLYQKNPNDLPGDYQIGYFGVRNYDKNERALVVELENGRLAMIVMGYYVVCDLVMWYNKLKGWENDRGRTLLRALAS